MGQMAGLMSPYIQTFGRQLNQQAFNDQLGRASNQMYQPPSQIGTYDPYTAARRPNYMPFGPNQQFYQPLYQPMYGAFGGAFQPPMQQFQPMMPQRTVLTPQPMQTQYRPIPYMTQTQLDARQNMFGNPGSSVGATSYDGSGGGYGDAGGFGGFGGGTSSDGGGYGGSGSVGAEGATASGGMGPGDGAGDGGAGASGAASGDSGGATSGEGLVSGGRVRKQSYGGIDALLRK
jgi:hypothetical protein